MRRLIQRLYIIVAIVIVATTLSTLIASSQEASDGAGLVVVHDDGRVTYSWVDLAGDSISGVDLLDHSGLEVTEVTFGGLGVGVCSIDETGCDVSVCRKRVCQGAKPDDPYWQYFIGNPDGTWSTSPLGVSGDTVKPGDVRAFVWSVKEPDVSAPTVDQVHDKATGKVSESAWLTRYAADGSILTAEPDSGSEIPFAALAMVAMTALGVMVVVVRSRAIGKQS